jgi:hypothetical protein
MSLLEMQRALCRVLTDRQTMQQFLADKDAALSDFALSDSELKAIQGINTDRLRRYSGLLIASRLDLALKAIPQVRKMLGDDFISRYGASYADKYPPIPLTEESPVLREFRNLLHFLDELTATHQLSIPQLSDMLKYEATRFILANDLQIAEMAEQFAKDYGPMPESGIALVSKPFRSPASVLHTFADAIVATNDGAISGHILFYKKVRSPAIRLLRLSDGTKLILDQCNGQTPLGEIVLRICQQFGISNVDTCTEQCVTACRMLSDRVIIGISRAES